MHAGNYSAAAECCSDAHHYVPDVLSSVNSWVHLQAKLRTANKLPDIRRPFLAEELGFELPFGRRNASPARASQETRAHLKNFGIVYDDVPGEARLAVMTSVYLPNDSMALTLNDTMKWASAKELQRLGETRMGSTR